MSTVVSFRVSRELKEKMEQYKTQVNWGEELRNYVEKRIKQLEKEKLLEEINKFLEARVTPQPPGTAEKLVREDREGH